MAIPGDFRRPDLFFVERVGPPAVIPSATTTGGMVGEARRGRTDKSYLVGSWGEYTAIFGGFPDIPTAIPHGTLAAYYHYQNGGGPLHYTRVVGGGAVVASKADFDGVKADGTEDVFDAYAQNVGVWGNDIALNLESYAHKNIATAVGINGAGGSPELVVDLQTTSGVSVGDIVSIYDEAGVYGGFAVVGNIIGGATSGRYATNRGLVAGRSYILIGEQAGTLVGGRFDAAGFTVRSCSSHLARTRLTEAYATGTTTLKVVSVAGLSVGSFISVVGAAIHESETASHAAHGGHARVASISGNTLTLAAALKDIDNVAVPNIPIDVKATLVSGAVGPNAAKVKLVSKLVGASGNNISLVVDADAGADDAALQVTSNQPGASYDGDGLYVTVVGQDIQVYEKTGAGLGTVTELVAALNANADVSALVTATVSAGGAEVVTLDAAKTYLTGGTDITVVSQEFDLQVKEKGEVVESHTNLSFVTVSENGVGTRLGGSSSVPNDNNQSSFITLVSDVDVSNDDIHSFPRSVTDVSLAGGVDGATPTDVQAAGSSTQGSETGLYVLQTKTDVDFLAVPGFGSAFVFQKGVALATTMNAVFVSGTPQTDQTFDAVVEFAAVECGVDSSYGALYAPWLKVQDPRDSDKIIEAPPTGFVTAEYAVVASTAGVHVAPANSPLIGPVDTVIDFTAAQRDVLNDTGINPIRFIRGAGFRIFGARMRYSNNDSRKYVPVRRWVNFFKRSLLTSFSDLLFRPANEALMGDVSNAVIAFLESEWAKGALYPDTSIESAFSVKCDSETTTAEDLVNGTINCEIRVSPVTPAEHIVFGLTVDSGGIAVNEAIA